MEAVKTTIAENVGKFVPGKQSRGTHSEQLLKLPLFESS